MNEFRKRAHQPTGERQCDIYGLKRVVNELVRICDWLYVRDIEVSPVAKLFEGPGDSCVHMVTGSPIRLGGLGMTQE